MVQVAPYNSYQVNILLNQLNDPNVRVSLFEYPSFGERRDLGQNIQLFNSSMRSLMPPVSKVPLPRGAKTLLALANSTSSLAMTMGQRAL